MEEKLVKSILLATANAFAPPEKLGRPRTDHGLLIDTFIRVLRTGMPWRDVRDVDFRTAHRHFILWARGGIFEKTYRRLLALCNRRKRDGTFLAIDTTFVKNVFGTDVLGRNPTDRGRKASKVVAVVDERGLPHRLGFLPANVTEDERRPRWSLSLTTKGCRIGWGSSPPTFPTTVCCQVSSRFQRRSEETVCMQTKGSTPQPYAKRFKRQGSYQG